MKAIFVKQVENKFNGCVTLIYQNVKFSPYTNAEFVLKKSEFCADYYLFSLPYYGHLPKKENELADRFFNPCKGSIDYIKGRIERFIELTEE